MENLIIKKELFENTILKDVDKDSENYIKKKKVIDSFFRTSSGYYILKYKSNEEQSKLVDLLLSLGYKKNPFINPDAFLSELRVSQINQEYDKVMSKETEATYKLTTEEVLQELKIANKRSESEYICELFKHIIKFRKILFYTLTVLMILETAVLFIFIFISSLNLPELKNIPTILKILSKFKVNNTTMQVLIGATVLQVSTMIVIIVRSVFPDSINRIITKNEDKE